jgi:uncharacterized cupin superfamily protein
MRTSVRHIIAGVAIAAVSSLATWAATSKGALPDLSVPHGAPSDFKWSPLPEFGGEEAIIYRSPDGRRVAAAFRESGLASFTYPFDEFLVVTSGSVRMAVRGGETFTLRTGDVAYLRKGLTVDMEFSEGFSDVTCLMGDEPVSWR